MWKKIVGWILIVLACGAFATQMFILADLKEQNINNDGYWPSETIAAAMVGLDRYEICDRNLNREWECDGVTFVPQGQVPGIGNSIHPVGMASWVKPWMEFFLWIIPGFIGIWLVFGKKLIDLGEEID